MHANWSLITPVIFFSSRSRRLLVNHHLRHSLLIVAHSSLVVVVSQWHSRPWLGTLRILSTKSVGSWTRTARQGVAHYTWRSGWRANSTVNSRSTRIWWMRKGVEYSNTPKRGLNLIALTQSSLKRRRIWTWILRIWSKKKTLMMSELKIGL